MAEMQSLPGPVALSGRFSEFRPDRVLLLVIRGAFGRADQLSGLIPRFPDFDIVFANLPGMHSPHMTEPSVAAFADAVDQAMAATLAGRRFIVLGASVGGLVALAMRSGAGRVAMDPPVSTAGLWPLQDLIRRLFATSEDPALRTWAWNILGVGETGLEDRDYRSLFQQAAHPSTVMIAGEPLEPRRPYEDIPGLISSADRDYLRTLPNIRRVWVPGRGHNLAVGSAGVLISEIRRMADLAWTTRDAGQPPD